MDLGSPVLQGETKEGFKSLSKSKEGTELKKIFAIALAVCMVFGMAAIASAVDMQEHHPVFSAKETEVRISGDARVRGFASWNKDFDKGNDTNENRDDVRFWDNRVRMKVDIKNAGGASAHFRLVMDEGIWQGHGAGGPGSSTVVADWAYVVIPVGPTKWTIGDQRADWGNKLLVWDNPRHRVKVTGKVGNVTLGALTDKIVETSDDGASNIGGDVAYRDSDDWAILAITNLGDVTLGIIGIYVEDTRRTYCGGPPSGDSRNVNEGCNLIANNDSHKVYIIDGFWKAKAGPLAINGEVVYGNNQGHMNNFGIFTDATVAVGPATVKGVVAHADGGFKADDDFIPVNLIGTDNPWAVMDFGGGICRGYTSSCASRAPGRNNEGKSVTMVGAAASFKPMENLTLAADAAYVWDELQHNVWMASLAGVVDITKGVKWTVLAGVADAPGSNNGQEFAWGQGHKYLVLGHKLDMSF